jgi:glycosyltransferase involved in cell wall biosynthesis
VFELAETTIPVYGTVVEQISSSHPTRMEVPVQEVAARPGDSGTKGLIAVIPAYNEQVAIGSVVILARMFVERVIVVDDGSTDKTSQVAQLAGAEVVTLKANSGKAHALLLGLKKAREMGCKAVVMLDADGQHFTKDIPRIAAAALSGDADLVIGSRFLENNGNGNGNIPLYRQFGQKTLDLFTNIGSRQNVTDSQSGYRALSCKALNYIDFASEGYNLESDMIAHFSANGLVITEVPIDVRYNVPNTHKKNAISHGMGVLAQLIKLISYRRPLYAFGLPGFILVVGGMIAEIMVFAELYKTGIFHYILALGSAFVVMMGMLLGIAGLILHSLVYIVEEQRK